MPVAVLRESGTEDLQPMGSVCWYVDQDAPADKSLYLLVASDKGLLYVYREKDFKNNGGKLVRPQPVIPLPVSPPRLIANTLVEKTEIFAVAINRQGYIAVNTEFGEIVLFERIAVIACDRDKRKPIIISEFRKV